MKLLLTTILCIVFVGEAVAVSSLISASLTLMGICQPAWGFFGFFKRRSQIPSIIEQDNPEPKGPVKFPPSFSSNLFPNPFSVGNRFPGILGGMQGNRFQAMPQFWPQSTNAQHRNQFQQSSMQFQQSNGGFQQPSMQFQQSNGGLQQPLQFQQPSQLQQSSAPESQPELAFDNENDEGSDEEPSINVEEAESFFTLLAETDENKCISRLVCELGADPDNAGDLGTSISEIIGSLRDFPEGSKVSEYNQVLQRGKAQGISSCMSEFTSCDQESYQLMRDSQNEQSDVSNE